MQIHGSWNIKLLEKNIVAVNVFDAWNKEAALAFAKDFRESVQPLVGQPWAIILSVKYASEVGTPEVVPIMAELNRWAIENGCICEAHMVKHVLQKSFSDMIRETPVSDAAPYTHMYVNELSEAIIFAARFDFNLETPIREVQAWFDDYPS